LTEIGVTAGSPAAGRTLADVTWPPGSTPVIVQRGHQLRPPQPDLTLAPGDRVSLLTAVPDGSPARHPAEDSRTQPASGGSCNHE
jgi:Trk K+ transport system NAD-binding subunit